MFVLRNHPKGALFASFGIGLCVLALLPKETGYQQIASLLARQSGASERWQRPVFSADPSIQLVAHSFIPPIGTSAPQVGTYRVASLDDRDITGSIAPNRVLQTPPRYQTSDYPRVDRTLKGDRLAGAAPAPSQMVAPPAVPSVEDPSTSNGSVFGAKTVKAPQVTTSPAPVALDAELLDTLRAPSLPQHKVTLSRADDELKSTPAATTAVVAPARDLVNAKASSLFSNSSLGGSENLQGWQSGEAPLVVSSDSGMR